MVDAPSGISGILGDLSKYSFRLDRIILTHGHFDHVLGIAEALNVFPAAELMIHPGDLEELGDKLISKAKQLSDGMKFKAAGSIELSVIHTPGHTPGCCCFLMNTGSGGFLFTGDTVFHGTCGRTDLDGGSNTAMLASLQKIKQLPPETVLLTGHQYSRKFSGTLAEEIASNDAMKASSLDSLEQLP